MPSLWHRNLLWEIASILGDICQELCPEEFAPELKEPDLVSFSLGSDRRLEINSRGRVEFQSFREKVPVSLSMDLPPAENLYGLQGYEFLQEWIRLALLSTNPLPSYFELQKDLIQNLLPRNLPFEWQEPRLRLKASQEYREICVPWDPSSFHSEERLGLIRFWACQEVPFAYNG